MALQSCVSIPACYSTFVYSLHIYGDLRERERERERAGKKVCPLVYLSTHVDLVLRCPLQRENVPQNVL